MKDNYLVVGRAVRLSLSLGCVAVFSASSDAATIVGSTGFEGPPNFTTGYTYIYNGDYAGYGNGGPNQDLQGNAVDSVGGYDPTSGVGGSGDLVTAILESGVPPAYPSEERGTPLPRSCDPQRVC